MTALKRTIGAIDLFALAVGTIIGVGWIVVVGSWLVGAGPGGALIGLGIGALAVAAIGQAYAEVFSKLPSTGGEVVVGSAAFGAGAGFAAGWVLIYIYFSVSAFEAISVGWLVTVMAPRLVDLGSYELAGGKVHVSALIVGMLGTALVGAANYVGASIAARLQKLLLVSILCLTLIFSVLAIVLGSTENLFPLVAGETPRLQFIGIVAVLATAPFWFAGFNVLPQALGERREGFILRRLGTIIVAAVFLAFVFYGLVIIATGVVLPRAEIAGLELPAASAFESAFQSRALANIVLSVGLLGLVSTWNAVIFAGARVLYCLSSMGALPKILSAVHPKFGTPHVAIVTVSLLSAVITPIGREALLTIVSAVGFGFSLMYALVTFALPVLRRKQHADGELGGYTMPGGNVAVMFTITVALALVGLSAFQLLSVIIQGAYWQVLVAAGWLSAGVIIWLAFRARTSTVQRDHLDLLRLD